jgi:hypothetical protein
MRAVWVLVLLAACGGAGARGPSWPKTAAVETDGGESLAPYTATAKAAAAAASSDDDDGDDDGSDDKPATPAAPAAKPAADKPAADKPAATTTDKADEPITTEEIIIEIED